jgi:hypothetical protein
LFNQKVITVLYKCPAKAGTDCKKLPIGFKAINAQLVPGTGDIAFGMQEPGFDLFVLTPQYVGPDEAISA